MQNCCILNCGEKITFCMETRQDLRMGWNTSECFVSGSLTCGSVGQGFRSTCLARGKMFPWFQIFPHTLGCQNVSSSRSSSPDCWHSKTCVPIRP